MWSCCPGIAGQRQQRPSYGSAFFQISCAGGKNPHGFGRGIIFWKGNMSFFCSQGRAGEAGVGGADLFSLYFIAWHVSHH